MKGFFTFLIFLMAISGGVFAQAILEGTIRDKDTGEPLDFAYIKLFRDGQMITGTQTDIDGNFVITNIDVGTYDVEASFLGYVAERQIGVVLVSRRVVRVEFNLVVQGVMLTELVITEYRAPLIDHDNTTSGAIITAEKIQNLPTRNVNAIAATTAGVSSTDGSSLAIRGGRTDATAYYIDGIRVIGQMLAQSEIEQMQVITGGLDARYGDAIGGGVLLTSRGPSQRFSMGAEVETSRYLDAFGNDLINAYISGPILKNDQRTILGFRVFGQFTGREDSRPSAIGKYRAPMDVISRLEAEPTVTVRGSRLSSGLYLGEDEISSKLKSAPNEWGRGYNFTMRLQARPVENLDITLGGTYIDNVSRFAPNKPWTMFNYHNNPYSYQNRYRVSLNLRHRIGKQGIDMFRAGGEGSSGSMVRNAFYTLNFAYENTRSNTEDFRHKDNLFNYGYHGRQDMELIPVVNIVDPDTWHGPGQQVLFGRTYDFVGYFRNFGDFEPNTEINPVASKFFDTDEIFANGRVKTIYNRMWNDLYLNVGQVYNSVQKSESERYSFVLSTGFDFLPSGSRKGRHSVEIGLEGEMTVQRAWTVAPLGLWQLAQEQQNLWIVGVDTNDVIGTFNQNIGGFDIEWQQYNTKLNVVEGSRFYRQIRELLGKGLHDYVNVDGEVRPDQLSLDMFSAKELSDKGLIGYYGYDYLGNKLGTNVKFNDFFDGKGKWDWSPTYNPLYGAVYIQNRFSFRDIIVRVGARIDYYDANTKVMKDPYSLYEIMDAKDFFDQFTQYTRPESVGDDYKVYVAGEESTAVIGYRKNDEWFLPNGTSTSGAEIFKGGLVYPYYKERVDSIRNIQSSYFNPNIAFEDYKPQVNFMPRIAFSFPISENAGFYAHYDVIVQRPQSNVLMTPNSYYYWESTSNPRYNNPNLRPEKTIDYEVGFQQKLTANSALRISAYYREQRDMIRLRPYFFVPYVTRYESYGNLDYGTIKGFTFRYDFRRATNLEFDIAYTLQFANSTGSDANSAAGLTNRGIIRNLYPTNRDERHRISATMDYRYFSGRLYNGPILFGKNILENAGANMQITAISGTPYTANLAPTAFGGSGFVGSINGSRKPWYFEVGLRVDKAIEITKKLKGTVYFRAENLLNTKNVLAVYPYTGDPQDDGFLLSHLGQNRIKTVVDSGLPVENFLAMYDIYRLNEGHYSRPRRLYFGLIFNL